jgi:hypothetical protein
MYSSCRLISPYCFPYARVFIINNIATDLINALPGNSSVNMVQQATIEEAVFSVYAVTSQNSGQRPCDMFSVDPTDTPIDWLDSDQVICAYCRSMSVPRLYKYE